MAENPELAFLQSALIAPQRDVEQAALRNLLWQRLFTNGATVSSTGELSLGVALVDAFNVKRFGATGDGVTNDAPAIVLGLAYLIARGGGTLYFPPGRYLVATSITTLNNSSNIRLVGHGAVITTTMNAVVFWLNHVTNFEAMGLAFVGDFAGVFLKGDQEAFASNPGGTGIRIHHCLFDALYVGIFFADGATDVNIDHNVFTTCNAPIAAGGGATKTRIRIQNNTILGSVSIPLDDAIALSGANEDVVISGNLIDFKGTAETAPLRAHGILLESSSPGLSCQRAIVSGNVIRNTIGTDPNQQHTAGIRISTNGGDDWADMVVSHNIIENAYCGIKATTVSGLILQGNTIRTTTAAGIELVETGDDVALMHNHIHSAGTDGISITSVVRPRMTGNLITNAATVGLLLDASADAVLIGNTARNSGAAGVQVNNSARPIVVGNALVSNATYGIQFTGTVTNPSLAANCLAGNTTAPTFGYSATGSNVRGAATFASAATVTVTFNEAEVDANYFVSIAGSANEGFWVTSKGTSGFTLNSSNATSTATVDWLLVR